MARSARYTTPVPLPGVGGTHRLVWRPRASVPITEFGAPVHIRSAQGALVKHRAFLLDHRTNGQVASRLIAQHWQQARTLAKLKPGRSRRDDRRLARGAEARDPPELLGHSQRNRAMPAGLVEKSQRARPGRSSWRNRRATLCIAFGATDGNPSAKALDAASSFAGVMD
jgi:hypothetical protein